MQSCSHVWGESAEIMVRPEGMWTDEDGMTYQGPMPPGILGPLSPQMWMGDPTAPACVAHTRGRFVECRDDDGTSLVEQWILDPRPWITYLEYLQLPVREARPPDSESVVMR